MEWEWKAHGTQICCIEVDAKKNCQETLSTTNWIEEAVMMNNRIFTDKWEATHDQIDQRAEEQLLLVARVRELESLLGLQQAALQHCQDTVAGLEETVAQLVMTIKKLEKTVCRCRDWLLSLGPHFAEGEKEEVVEDSEEEDGLKYKMEDTSKGSYITPPSTGGCSKPSLAPSHSPTLGDSDPENNVILRTNKLEAHIKVFLEEAEEDMEMEDMPPLENVSPLPVPAPFPGFVPFAMSTSQHCVPPKTLLNKVYHPYRNPVGRCRCEPGGWCHELPCSGWI